MYYVLSQAELKHFIRGMWKDDVSSNVSDGLLYLESIDHFDGAFNFNQIEAVQLKYPIVFAPLYKLQVHIIQYSLGELWWDSHKANLVEERLEKKAVEMAQLVKKERAEEKEAEVVTDDMIRKRMGVFKYYLMPWQRPFAKARILRIAAIEDELDKNMKMVTKM
jgi:hypothetical protein